MPYPEGWAPAHHPTNHGQGSSDALLHGLGKLGVEHRLIQANTLHIPMPEDFPVQVPHVVSSANGIPDQRGRHPGITFQQPRIALAPASGSPLL